MAGRRPAPVAKLMITGGYRADRHGRRLHDLDAKPLGSPPRHLSAAARRCWREVAAVAGWLSAGDGPTWKFTVSWRPRPEPTLPAQSAAKLSLLASLGGRLGLSPTDRARITWPKAPAAPPDPGERFFVSAAGKRNSTGGGGDAA